MQCMFAHGISNSCSFSPDDLWQVLRVDLGCNLPVEVAYHGEDEFDATIVQLLKVHSSCSPHRMTRQSMRLNQNYLTQEKWCEGNRCDVSQAVDGVTVRDTAQLPYPQDHYNPPEMHRYLKKILAIYTSELDQVKPLSRDPK